MRLYLALNFEGFWGVDGGAYGVGYLELFGFEAKHSGFSRPPLAPGWLLYPFVETWGFDTGYKIWSSLASLSPVVPVVLFARRLECIGGSTPSIWVAPFAAGFILLDLLHAEMFVTGALPLIAFGLLGIAWWAMGSLCEQPAAIDITYHGSRVKGQRRQAWLSIILAVCIGLIPWVNQTTAGLAVITLPVYAVGLLWYSRNRRLERSAIPIRTTARALRSLTPPMFVGGVFALLALPWYMDVLPGSGQLDYPGPVIYFTRWPDPAWSQLAIGVTLGLLMVWKGAEPWLRSLGTLLILLSTLTVFLSYDETVINIFFRSRYLMSIPFFVGITWVVWRLALPWFGERKAEQLMPVAITAAVAALMLTGYVMQVHGQSEKSAMISTETAEILAEMKRDHYGEGIITNSFTLSLWISALTEAPTFTTWNAEPPEFFQEDDRRVRCVLGWVPGCDVFDATEKLGAKWVLIEGKFPWYFGEILGVPGVYGSLNYDDPWADLPNLPWLSLEYDRGSTRVYSISSQVKEPSSRRLRKITGRP